MPKEFKTVIFVLTALFAALLVALVIHPKNQKDPEVVKKFEQAIVSQSTKTEVWSVGTENIHCLVLATTFMSNGQTLFQIGCK